MNDDAVEDLVEEAVEQAEKKRSPIKMEWLITAGTALAMTAGGGVSLTAAESRVNDRLTVMETTHAQEEKADDRRIRDYDARLSTLELESKDLRHELSIRREYQRHVHAHICALLAKAHGPKSAQTEALCSLPEPEFKK